MFKEKKFDEIVVYKMGRSIFGKTIYPVHCFLLDDLLVDTGTLYSEQDLLNALSKREVKNIVNTHFHEDHAGNNRAIQNRFGAEVLAHKDSISFLKKPEKNRLRLYQKIAWKLPEKCTAETAPETIKTENFELEVIEAKGHSNGGIYLYDEMRGHLFTGDMFCGVKNIYFREDEVFDPMLESLKKISKLKINTIFCGLKGVVEDGSTALERKIEYMTDLKEKVLLLRREGINLKNIKKRLLGKEDAMYYITGGHFSKQNLINSIANGD